MEVRFPVKKTTANMVRYEAADPADGSPRPDVLGHIYVSKEAAAEMAGDGSAYPEFLVLDIKAG
jgi:hypothetical protein